MLDSIIKILFGSKHERDIKAMLPILHKINEKEAWALSLSAVRFAAKEAFGKALGTGLAGIELKDIAVVNDKTGRPFLKLSGTALQALKEKGVASIHLSLTHEKTTAAAVVIIESSS